MKIATWNVNGLRARIETLLEWLDRESPDVVCLQEIKMEDQAFPREPFEEKGYNVETHGQKSFNGVALLSKLPFDEVNRGLAGDESDHQARFIEGVFPHGDGVVRVVSLYLPNGNPVDGEKFDYKRAWMSRLLDWTRERLILEEPLAMGGDYNVIPEPMDCADPDEWRDDALFRPEIRAAWREMIHLGMTDALRAVSDEEGLYTFWDYQGGAWRKNDGIRIDHFLLSPEATDLLEAAGVDAEMRGQEKPSDHVPVWIALGNR